MPLPGGATPTVMLPVETPAVYGSDRDGRTSMLFEVDGAGVEPSRCAFELVDVAGSVVFAADSEEGGTNADAVEMATTGAVVTVPAAVLAAQPRAKTYRERWRLYATVDEVEVEVTQTRPAAIAPYPLEPVLGRSDVLSGHSSLAARLGTESITPYIVDAWTETIRWLWGQDRWPEEIVDVDQLVDVVRELARERIYRDMSNTPDDIHWKKADIAERRATAARDGLRYRSDTSQSGVATSQSRDPVVGVYHANGSAHRFNHLPWR